MKAIVYDLINAGPRHRFTVRGRDGRPFIVSNCVQATARDILVEAILRIEERFPGSIVLHVHDEVICEVEQDVPVSAIKELMEVTPEWAPGLPIGSSAEEAERYFK